MFDYQAGEKYKLTLIMVALAGLMAGMFFTVLLMPTPEAPQARRRAHAAWMDNPDVTGRPRGAGDTGPGAAQAQQGQVPAAPGMMTDPTQAMSFVEQLLPVAWDLSAGSAAASQARAIAFMTPECAQQYQQSIWTPEIAQQVDASGVRSQFRPIKVQAGDAQMDGSVVIFVEAEQALAVPGAAVRQRHVRVEYLVKTTPEGMRIAGITDTTQGG